MELQKKLAHFEEVRIELQTFDDEDMYDQIDQEIAGSKKRFTIGQHNSETGSQASRVARTSDIIKEMEKLQILKQMNSVHSKAQNLEIQRPMKSNFMEESGMEPAKPGPVPKLDFSNMK